MTSGLEQARAERNAARAALTRAQEAAEVGRRLVASLEDGLAEHAGLEAEVAQARADGIRQWAADRRTSAPVLDLPPALTRRRMAAMEAENQLAAARAGLAALEGAERDAEALMEAAQATVDLQARTALRSEAEARVQELMELEECAAAIRSALNSYCAAQVLRSDEVVSIVRQKPANATVPELGTADERDGWRSRLRDLSE